MPNWKSQTREYQNAARQARRDFARNYLGGKCVRCSAKEELHFDHIDPATKTFDISQGLSYGLDKFIAELKKCQLLCRHCHYKKTSYERVGPNIHGRYTTHHNHHCRCEPCIADYNRYMREYARSRRLS